MRAFGWMMRDPQFAFRRQEAGRVPSPVEGHSWSEGVRLCAGLVRTFSRALPPTGYIGVNSIRWNVRACA